MRFYVIIASLVGLCALTVAAPAGGNGVVARDDSVSYCGVITVYVTAPAVIDTISRLTITSTAYATVTIGNSTSTDLRTVSIAAPTSFGEKTLPTIVASVVPNSSTSLAAESRFPSTRTASLTTKITTTLTLTTTTTSPSATSSISFSSVGTQAGVLTSDSGSVSSEMTGNEELTTLTSTSTRTRVVVLTTTSNGLEDVSSYTTADEVAATYTIGKNLHDGYTQMVASSSSINSAAASLSSSDEEVSEELETIDPNEPVVFAVVTRIVEPVTILPLPVESSTSSRFLGLAPIVKGDDIDPGAPLFTYVSSIEEENTTTLQNTVEATLTATEFTSAPEETATLQSIVEITFSATEFTTVPETDESSLSGVEPTAVPSVPTGVIGYPLSETGVWNTFTPETAIYPTATDNNVVSVPETNVYHVASGYYGKRPALPVEQKSDYSSLSRNVPAIDNGASSTIDFPVPTVSEYRGYFFSASSTVDANPASLTVPGLPYEVSQYYGGQTPADQRTEIVDPTATSIDVLSSSDFSQNIMAPASGGPAYENPYPSPMFSHTVTDLPISTAEPTYEPSSSQASNATLTTESSGMEPTETLESTSVASEELISLSTFQTTHTGPGVTSVVSTVIGINTVPPPGLPVTFSFEVPTSLITSIDFGLEPTSTSAEMNTVAPSGFPSLFSPGIPGPATVTGPIDFGLSPTDPASVVAFVSKVSALAGEASSTSASINTVPPSGLPIFFSPGNTDFNTLTTPIELGQDATSVALVSSATLSSKAASATCGEQGSFSLNFDELPPLAVPINATDVQPMPIFSPYKHFYFSEGFVVGPPPRVPFIPESAPLLLQFVAQDSDVTRNHNTPAAGQYGATGEIGVGDNLHWGCYTFDAIAAAVGCDSLGPVCEFQATGVVYNAATGEYDENYTTFFETPGCPAGENCALTDYMFLDEFKGIQGLRINATVEGVPKIWWLDDLQLMWSDGSCEAGDCRASHH